MQERRLIEETEREPFFGPTPNPLIRNRAERRHKFWGRLHYDVAGGPSLFKLVVKGAHVGAFLPGQRERLDGNRRLLSELEESKPCIVEARHPIGCDLIKKWQIAESIGVLDELIHERHGRIRLALDIAENDRMVTG